MYIFKNEQLDVKWDKSNEGLRLYEVLDNFVALIQNIVSEDVIYFHIKLSNNIFPNFFNIYSTEMNCLKEEVQISGKVYFSNTDIIKINFFEKDGNKYSMFWEKTAYEKKFNLLNDSYITFQEKNTLNWLKKLIEFDDYKDIEKRICFFGDSITRGKVNEDGYQGEIIQDDNLEIWENNFYHAKNPFPKVCTKYLNEMFNTTTFRHINLGLSGKDARQMYRSFWKNRNCDLSVIMLGTNDATMLSSEDYIKYIELLIERTLRYGSMVILINPLYSKTKYRKKIIGSIRGVNKILKHKYGIPILDLDMMSESMDTNFYTDWLHPNQIGHNFMGMVLASYLSGDHMLLEHKNRLQEGECTLMLPEITNIYGDFIVTKNKGMFQSPLPGWEEEDKGSQLNIEAGGKVYVPIYAPFESLYIFPIINFGSFEGYKNLCEVKFQIANEQFFMPSNLRWTSDELNINELKKSYKNNTLIIKPENLNYLNNLSFCLKGCINQKVEHSFSAQNKGWQILKIENTGKKLIAFYGIEVMSEDKYLYFTGNKTKRYTYDDIIKNNRSIDE